METFRIRPATFADVQSLHHLIERSVRELQVHDYSARQIEGALGHTLGLDTQLIADATYFVAEPQAKPGLIVACGGWSMRRTLFGSDAGPNREATFLDPQAEAARIRAIFVHPDWARRGLGSLLLKHCEETAQKAGFQKFEMGSTLTGVPLYRLKGYREQKRLEVPLPNGEVLPVIQMTKETEPGAKG